MSNKKTPRGLVSRDARASSVKLEGDTGFEPVMGELQSPALPLG